MAASHPKLNLPIPIPAFLERWLVKLLHGRSEQLLVQFIRYAIVGVIATLVDFSILVLLTSGLGIHYLVSNTAAFFAGLGVNYALSVRWVFSTRNVRSQQAEFVIFGLIALVGLGISQGCMYLGVDVIGLHYVGAKWGSVVFTLMWNFTARKLLLFRDSPKAS